MTLEMFQILSEVSIELIKTIRMIHQTDSFPLFLDLALREREKCYFITMQRHQNSKYNILYSNARTHTQTHSIT